MARADSRPIELRSDEILDGVTGLIGAYPSLVDARGLGLTEAYDIQETLRWFGSTRSAMLWVLRFLARRRCA